LINATKITSTKRKGKKMKRFIIAILVICTIPLPVYALEEGGYAGTTDEGHDAVVYNFLRHFDYEQYYYASQHQFTWNNNARVDNMDFAIFAGHGSQWSIATLDGNVDLSTAGTASNLGYGDTDCEFIAFESCKVVPSPLEVEDWWTNWVHTGGIFDGLHQALGFRTSSYQSTDQNITYEFGKRIAAGNGVYTSWFDAINQEGATSGILWWKELIEFGSAVMHPTCQNDTYYSFAADPPASSTALTIWYQH
jgi:hypothetical protein